MADDLPAREAMEFDVVIVGAGPAGLAAAIRLKQLDPEHRRRRGAKRAPRSARISSPAPWSIRSASTGCCPTGAARTRRSRRRSPTTASISSAPAGALRLPNFVMPPLMNNHGNYIVSLGNVCRWLASKAEALGRRDLSGLCRGRSALRRERRGHRRRHRRHGHRQGRRADGPASRAAWSCAANIC